MRLSSGPSSVKSKLKSGRYSPAGISCCHSHLQIAKDNYNLKLFIRDCIVLDCAIGVSTCFLLAVGLGGV
jgi:hypothetical protein